jgi:hypothetical protein
MQVTGGRYRYYNIWRPIMTSSLKYCLTQELNPFDYSNELGTLSLYLTLGMLALPLPYIIYQISKLCKIAYSYSNFYLYESYKLYSLVLITSISTPPGRLSHYDQPGSRHQVPPKNRGRAPLREVPQL